MVLLANRPSLFSLFFFPLAFWSPIWHSARGEKCTALFWIKLRTALGRLVALFWFSCRLLQRRCKNPRCLCARASAGFSLIIWKDLAHNSSFICALLYFCAFPFAPPVMEQWDKAGMIQSRLLFSSINHEVVVWVKTVAVSLCHFRIGIRKVALKWL